MTELPILAAGARLKWKDLTRSAIRERVTGEFAEGCYTMIVLALAQCADEQAAVPKNVMVAFSRKPDQTLQVHARATYNGEHFEYDAILPDPYDREWRGTLQ